MSRRVVKNNPEIMEQSIELINNIKTYQNSDLPKKDRLVALQKVWDKCKNIMGDATTTYDIRQTVFLRAVSNFNCNVGNPNFMGYYKSYLINEGSKERVYNASAIDCIQDHNRAVKKNMESYIDDHSYDNWARDAEEEKQQIKENEYVTEVVQYEEDGEIVNQYNRE